MANTPVVVLDDTLTDIANAIRGKNGSSDTYMPGQMADAIDNIPSGGGGTGIPREVNATGAYGYPEQDFIFSLPADATDVSNSALHYAFSNCSSLISVELSFLTTVSGSSALYYAFSGCTSLDYVDISSLTTVSGGNALYYVFSGCTSLDYVNLSSLTTVSGVSAFASAFSNCSSLTSVDLSSLTTVSSNKAFNSAFSGCTSFDSVSFPALTTVSGSNAFNSAFFGCTSLTSVSFPALTTSSFGTATNQFNNMLQGVTGCTVHFPAAIQAKIETMTGYPNFGGTNTTVLFDL